MYTFLLTSSLIHPKGLPKFLAYKRHSVDICWMKEWFTFLRIFCISNLIMMIMDICETDNQIKRKTNINVQYLSQSSEWHILTSVILPHVGEEVIQWELSNIATKSINYAAVLEDTFVPSIFKCSGFWAFSFDLNTFSIMS